MLHSFCLILSFPSPKNLFYFLFIPLLLFCIAIYCYIPLFSVQFPLFCFFQWRQIWWSLLVDFRYNWINAFFIIESIKKSLSSFNYLFVFVYIISWCCFFYSVICNGSLQSWWLSNDLWSRIVETIMEKTLPESFVKRLLRSEELSVWH